MTMSNEFRLHNTATEQGTAAETCQFLAFNPIWPEFKLQQHCAEGCCSKDGACKLLSVLICMIPQLIIAAQGDAPPKTYQVLQYKSIILVEMALATSCGVTVHELKSGSYREMRSV